MAKRDISFGLQLLSFFNRGDGTHLGTLAHAGGFQYNAGRQSTKLMTAVGTQTGEFTTGYQGEATITGLKDASPDLDAFICGRATVAGSNAALANPNARVIDALAGDWDEVTVTAANNAVPGLYLVESTAASTETVRRYGQLRGVDFDAPSAAVTDSGITLAGTGRAALGTTGKALISVEPACAAAHVSVGGRPGHPPPHLTVLASSDPTAADADGRAVRWVMIPDCTVQTDPGNMTSLEPNAGDYTLSLFYDSGIDGTIMFGHYAGIVQPTT